MKYAGKVKDGVVLLDSPNALQDGTIVTVEPVSPPARGKLGQKLKRFAGVVQDLPRDIAQNHDHYLHGRPKK